MHMYEEETGRGRTSDDPQGCLSETLSFQGGRQYIDHPQLADEVTVTHTVSRNVEVKEYQKNWKLLPGRARLNSGEGHAALIRVVCFDNHLETHTYLSNLITLSWNPEGWP